jgi:hypothetical protein
MLKKLLKDAEGGWSWKKIGALFMVPVTMFVLSTWYNRYSWLRDQAYKVDRIEKSLESKDKQIAILHDRISKETDKREATFHRLLDLIMDAVKQQQKQIDIQQKQMEQAR